MATASKCPRLLAAREFGRDNSLNLFRLILATMVIISHSFALGAYSDLGAPGQEPVIGMANFGNWGVTGFFCISGYLIAKSRDSSGKGRYLVKRVARIFPAFVVVQLLIVFVFGPIAQLLNHGSLEGYFTTQPTPLHYLFTNVNLGLWIDHYDIGDTLAAVPFQGTWNGPLYTLYYEFSCYLLVGFLFSFKPFRKPAVLGAVWLATSVIAMFGYKFQAWDPTTIASQNLLHNFLRFVPLFLGGSLVYVLEKTWLKRYGPALALLSLAVVVLAQFAPQVPALAARLTPDTLGIIAPFFTYLLLYLSLVCRCGVLGRLTQKHDISYGMYIYGWVMQQLIMLLVVRLALPFPPVGVYILLAILSTAVFAVASWRLVEKPVLDKVRGK